MSGARSGRVLLGAMRLALLRPEGIEAFGADRRSFLNSLVPLLAFPVGGFFIGLLSGAGGDSLSGLLATIVALLTPPVVSEALARWWGREAAWLRYATAFNWTRWAMLLALAVGMTFATVLLAAGVSPDMSMGLAMLAVGVYGAVLDWFVARVGLEISRGRAVVLVVAVNVGAAVTFLGPRLLVGGLS